MVVSKATSLIRCCSPPGMSFFLGKSVSYHCSPREHIGWFATDLNVPCWWIGQIPPHHIPTQFVLVVLVLEVYMDRVTALCCLKLGSWVPGKCHTFVCCFSAREDNFCMTLDVRHQAATLCQLIVMLHSRLVTGCPHTMASTMGTRFLLQALPLPSGEMPHALGPRLRWTNDSKTSSLMV